MENNFSKEELQRTIESKNLAEDLDEEELIKMGQVLKKWIDADEEARTDWMNRNAQWMELACQVQTKKSYPWPDAANVKFPLLTTAAMQFAARSYPALVPGPNLVAGIVVGKDNTGQRFESASRVGKHMSYQLLFEMEGWEEDMDRLCMMLPIVGCVFKKTYFDPVKQQNVSELVQPTDLVIDYFAKSVESAFRKAHIIYKTRNDIKERINRGLWLDIPLPEPGLGEQSTSEQTQSSRDKIDGTSEPEVSAATPLKFVEYHCWWDLDGDGYDEPYIITFHYSSGKVVRIVARFEVDGVEYETDEKTGKEKLIRIKPIEYFTKFGFIPNPDGSIYDLGFGILLGGINESVNTLTNQLLDSGTINNLQSGFLGRGIRVRSGGSRFLPGEWKPVDFTGDDIRKHIFPLPTKEPSSTLFSLLETLVTSGKELASVAEIFVGKMPGQNTPATTTMATIEQGLKVFTAIHKRMYRALAQEYKKLFRLNSIHIDGTVYFTINEQEGPKAAEIRREDYSPENISVKPNADPNVVSQSQKLMKVQSYGPLLQIGTINPQEYTKRFLEAVEAENIESLMKVQPQPSPEEKQMQMEAMLKQQEAQLKQQVEEAKLAIKAQESQLKQQEQQMNLRFKMIEMQLKEREMQIELMGKEATVAQDVTANAAKHQQKLQFDRENQEIKKQKAKEQPKGDK